MGFENVSVSLGDGFLVFGVVHPAIQAKKTIKNAVIAATCFFIRLTFFKPHIQKTR
jgi:hypothetical protein